MAETVDTTLRGPKAYSLARTALEGMERHQVWPTPINFELWLHYVGDPDGPLGREIERLLAEGQPFTEDVSEELAQAYLPKARLNEQIRDAGDQLSKELEMVAKAIAAAHKSSEIYGATLEDASQELNAQSEPQALRKIVQNLASATRTVQSENRSLEERLKESTAEVTRLREHLEQVRRDATTDALTMLANRKAFDEELDRCCAEAEVRGQPLTLAVIDIDHFKNFNDTWGHQTGDQVIRYVASVLGRVAATPRFAARYGGEEFGVLFPAEQSAQVFVALEEARIEISSRMLKRRSTNEDLGTVTISIGLADRRSGEDAHSLMDRADSALYESKRNGRNRTTIARIDADAVAA